MQDLSGQRIGQYEILSLLGEGGMAAVFRARQTSVDREVAIKVIKTGLIQMDEFVRRFEREAKTVANLDHLHILKVFDYGREGDMVYLVMQLLTGGSLANKIARDGALPVETCIRLLDQMASALDYAHERGIIHRDMKPQNVLLDANENAFLTDFGIAKLRDGSATALTQSGGTIGTPAYMSPEQWKAETVDSRADIYALGVILYEMLTGNLPFSGETAFGLMHKHVYEAPPPIRDVNPDLSLSVERVINKVLAKDKEMRFGSASALARAFRKANSDEGWQDTDEPTEIKAPVVVSTGSKISRPPKETSVPTEPSRTQDTLVPAMRPRQRSLMTPVLAVLLIAAVATILLLTSQNNANMAATETAAAFLPTERPSLTPTTAPTETETPTFTLTPSETATLTPSVTPQLQTIIAETISARQTITQAAIALQSATPNDATRAALIIGATDTAVAIASFTKTPTPTDTNTPTATNTASATPTLTPTYTPTATETPVPTATETPTTAPTEPPTVVAVLPDSNVPTGQIVFVSNRDGNEEIYIVNADGRNPRNLTRNSARDVNPAVSADGKRIAFSSNREGNPEIYAMDINGDNVTRLTNDRADDSQPAWSPDGQLLAFVSNRDGNAEIYIHQVNNLAAPPRRLTEIASVDQRPAFSPDGRVLAFISDERGVQQLYTITLNGDNRRIITEYRGGTRSFAWSPDGKRFVVSADRNNDRRFNIYLINADGSNALLPEVITSGNRVDVFPVWSGDGAWLFWLSNRGIGVAGVYNIWTARARPNDNASTEIGREPSSALNDSIGWLSAN